ncbi:heterokaryon incompatibility protein-domain-containing protein [Truncatella angustata]|uniref:Heterokaryon incompatibility protein-domain-containing protein n=1 Tax=Truncatella angustata TaxID=152316 RepID=A0A9P8UD54_9PEZI|nr:heterokaryon incompatibility protein-domain-containing protein [Truncatella angustata]KAH6646792.1 heterokaryon incompatibility protein-domain-containing protein [Truncatella angustata]
METHSKLCDTCQHVKLEDYLYQAKYPGTVELGRFQDVAKKSDCPLCRLVIQALNIYSRQYWKAGVYPVEVCYLGWHVEKSNQPVLDVWFNSTSETLPDGMWGHSTTLGQIIPLYQPLAHTASEAGVIGRTQLVGEKIDISRLRGWMNSCASFHGPNCNPPKLHITERPDLRLLLVDVRRMRLAECDWGSRYVALSYVWGSSKSLVCTKTNIHHLQKDGSLRKLRGELPRAINDAIDLTDAVGEAYLWVDALCIIQDDNSSKDVYISRMNQIYGNAYVTLVTLNGLSDDSALPGVTHSRILVQSPVEINGLHLVPRLPELSFVEQFSAWSRRAWTFQEGILSRRCLYFAEHQVFWQCRTAYQAEDNADDHDQDVSDFGRGRRVNALDRESGNDRRMQFNIFESLVKQYSPRDVTFSADALNAFAGILSAMTESFGWKFAYALPESLFDLALLWRPMFSATMRPRWSSGQSEESFCTSPTWCWTSWRGDIFWSPWRLQSFAGQEVTLKTEIVSFWVQDSGGLRQIRRGRALDSDAEITGYTAGEQITPESALVFEAKTINIEAYSISEPRIDQCALWNGDKAGINLSDYFRNNMSHSSWIYDSSGQHCGTLDAFKLDAEITPCKNYPRYDLVLLSRSGQGEVTQAAIEHFQDRLPPEYPFNVEYYEEIFDTRHYSYKTDWALNIMLVRWKNNLAERVAIGQMHVDSWNEALQESSLITLV